MLKRNTKNKRKKSTGEAAHTDGGNQISSQCYGFAAK
jgi:hypothetical protein